jgi:hypothetical protein
LLLYQAGDEAVVDGQVDEALRSRFDRGTDPFKARHRRESRSYVARVGAGALGQTHRTVGLKIDPWPARRAHDRVRTRLEAVESRLEPLSENLV